MEVEPGEQGLTLHGGLFGRREEADDGTTTEEMFVVGRAAWARTWGATTIEAAVNGGYDGTEVGRGVRYGADGRVRRGAWTVVAEALRVTEDRPDAAEAGVYGTLIYALADAHRLRTRWDAISTTDPELPEHLAGFGYTLLPADPVRIEVDVLVPMAPLQMRESMVLVNVQLSL